MPFNKKYQDKEYCYYATYTYRDKLMKKLSRIWVKCSYEKCRDCGGKYNLAEPCIWHLSDSYDHQKRFKEFKRRRKAETMTDDDKEQLGLY
jgi:rRNA maturation protein Nop10